MYILSWVATRRINKCEFLAVNSKIYFLLNAEQTDSDGLEAMLVRKHEWESTTKKASNR